MSKTQFGIAPLGEWVISPSVGAERRELLLGAGPFETIVERLFSDARIIGADEEPMDNRPGFCRTKLNLLVDRQALDVWHNGSTGYRAQYYLGVENGEAANAYAVRRIVSQLASLPRETPKRGDDFWERAQISIADPHAKCWIHQGLWLRHARRHQPQLLVQRWLTNQESSNGDLVKLAHWGTLAPSGETKLNILGGWVDQSGNSLGRSAKPNRAVEQRDTGFT